MGAGIYGMGFVMGKHHHSWFVQRVERRGDTVFYFMACACGARDLRIVRAN